MWSIVHLHPQFKVLGNDLSTQYFACIAIVKKDVKLYVAKGSVKVDNTNDNSQNGLQQ